MPELPEVETVKNGLQAVSINSAWIKTAVFL